MRMSTGLFAAALCLAASAQAADPAYDLVFRDAQIVDGTGSPRVGG